MTIELVSPGALAAVAAEFHALLRDAVEHGASIGFTSPLADAEVADYWQRVGVEISAGNKVLLAAREASGRLAGSGQLALESRANGRHRAEVQKLMVFTTQRGRGTGAALMAGLEAAARAHGRTLLFLDTSQGEGGAMQFYARLGYVLAGSIPAYARDPDGSLRPNAIYYKQLP
jgi:acetyltransferase